MLLIFKYFHVHQMTHSVKHDKLTALFLSLTLYLKLVCYSSTAQNIGLRNNCLRKFNILVFKILLIKYRNYSDTFPK